MFMGEYNHSIDPKGRLIVPSKLRDELGEKFVVARGMESCLFVYAMDKWMKIVEKLNGQNITNESVRKFQRQFIGGAHDCELDKQGRVLLPPILRTYAGIVKDAVFIGAGDRIEIWSAERWQAELEAEGDLNTLATNLEVAGLGI